MSGQPEINYGPLQALIGKWTGDKGMDIAPEPDGTEENPFYETIDYSAAGELDNAESQNLVIVSYHRVVSRKSNDEVFHDQLGYWMWDAKENVLMHSLIIPRAVSVLAGGQATESASGVVLKASAKSGDKHWGILQSPFMAKNAKTLEYTQSIEIDGDGMHYFETTELDIYGRKFSHTDENRLTRTR